MIDELIAAGSRYQLLQAIRILESSLAVESLETGAKFPLGQSGLPAGESVRFRQNSSASFSPSEIVRVQRQPGSDSEKFPLEITINAFNLVGQCGALPAHYTSFSNERKLVHRDSTFEAFLDMFQHRAVSLLYKSFLKSRLDIGTEQARLWDQQGLADVFSVMILAICGMSTPGMLEHQNVQQDTFLYYSGHYSARTSRLVGLEALLTDYFDVEVQIQQFKGYWIEIPESSQTSMKQGKNAPRLGQNFISGSRIWDQCSKIRVRLGPLTAMEMKRFLPGSPLLLVMRDMIKTSIGMECDYEIQLILKAEAVPNGQLGGSQETPTMLGYNSWVLSKPAATDAEDVVISSAALEQFSKV